MWYPELKREAVLVNQYAKELEKKPENPDTVENYEPMIIGSAAKELLSTLERYFKSQLEYRRCYKPFYVSSVYGTVRRRALLAVEDGPEKVATLLRDWGVPICVEKQMFIVSLNPKDWNVGEE